MAVERVVWYVWADSLFHAIPNNSGQSDLRMVMCLPKSHAKLIRDKSQALFRIFCHQQPTIGDIQVYTREDVFCISSNRSREVSVLYSASSAAGLVEVSGVISRINGGRRTF